MAAVSRPRRNYRPDIARRTRDISRHGFATCADCGKRAFTSKTAAKRGARVLYPESRMRVYRCGEWWHLTSQDAARAAEMRGRAAGRPEPGGAHA